MSIETDVIELRAKAFSVELPKSLSEGLIMYMPGGDHTVTPSTGKGTAEVTVRIDEATAPVLNASLARMNAALAPQRCFIDKEHEKKEATAWPQGFVWRQKSPDGIDAPGVYCKVEFTGLGQELIEKRIMRSFSPGFRTDADMPKASQVRAGQHITIPSGKRGSPENPARIIGVAVPDIGGLTNLPAFHEILPLWAKDTKPAPAAAVNTPESGTNDMKKTDNELITLRARKAELEQNIPVFRARDLSDVALKNELSQAESELQGVDLQLKAHDMAVQNETLSTALKDQRTKDADAAIAAAIKRGAIPAKNEQLRASWRNRLIEDPANIELLNGISSAPALSGGGGSQPTIILRNGGSVQEMRASNRDVLRRIVDHVNAKEHSQAAALYAREIRPRLKEGDDIELRAADVTDANLGTLAGTLVTQRTLELYAIEIGGVMGMITTDFSDVAAQFKQTTQTRIIVVPGVQAYDETVQADGMPKGFSGAANAITVDAPITLDQHKAVQITIGVNLLSTTARRLFDEQAPAASYALAKDSLDALYARITPGNFNSYVGNVRLGGGSAAGVIKVPEVDFTKGALGIAGRIFNPAGVPTRDRFALLNSDYHDTLENDPTLIRLAAYQSAQTGIITDGTLPAIKKFRPIEAPNLPATNNLVGFAGHKSSLLIQSRVPNDYTKLLPPGATHGLVQTVTNPDNGMTAMIVWYADHLRATGNFRIAWMYGTAVGDKRGGLCMVSN